MAQPQILVVDSDEGFGHMLREGLNNSGYYQAECVHSAREAMKTILKGPPCDMVIIDMALADVSPVKLVQAIRKAKSEMRIMLIPLMGQQLPDGLEEKLQINGVLSKPFFVGDLPDVVNQALGIEGVVLPEPSFDTPTSSGATAEDLDSQTVAETATEEPTLAGLSAAAITVPTVPQDIIRYLRGNETEILRLLDDLNREVRAEAILLIAGRELIAQEGMLSREQCRELSVLVAQSSRAAAQAATFLGEDEQRFAQSLHEGSEYRVYTLTLADGILLSVALSSNVPLGMIRHRCRHTASQLGRFI